MNKTKSKQSISSPKLTAGIFSRLFFIWLYPLLQKGRKKDLQYEDVYKTLPEDRSKTLGDQLAFEWKAELKSLHCKHFEIKTKNCEEGNPILESSIDNDDGEESKCKRQQRPSLAKALTRIFGWRFAIVGIFLLIEECVVKIAQSFCLGLLLRYFSGEYDERHGFLFAGGVIVCSMYYTVSHHPCFYSNAHLNMRVRIACSSLIYRKSLKLSQAALTQTTVGQLVNILSNDVARLDSAVTFLHYLWIGPIQLGLVVWILWGYFGPICLTGIVFLVLFTPFQSLMGHLFSLYRNKVVVKTDKRIRLMNEIVNGIRVIKMYAWEIPFSNLVADSRTDEIKTVGSTMMLRATNLCLCYVFSKVIIFLTLVTYVLTGNFLTAEKVFVAMSLYQNVRVLMTIFFPLGITCLADTLVSIRRIENVLLLGEYDAPKTKRDSDYHVADIKKKKEPEVRLQNVTAQWSPERIDPTLSHINLQVKRGQLLAVIGTVGSGKSSLLQVILQELPVTFGEVRVEGSIAYVPQESWVFSGSVRDNILFGKPYTSAWYEKVVDACALEKDFEMLSHGDQTTVGDKGRSLSGGQKARINLARAVYANADIYLLDDPLSAVDSEIGRHLFEKCLCGMLKNKICILVTHQLQFLPRATEILLLNHGKVIAKGDYSFFQKTDIDIEMILATSENKTGDRIECEDRKRQSSISGASLDNHVAECVSKSQHDESSGLSRSCENNEDGMDGDSREFKESIASGGIGLSCYWKYIRAGSNLCTLGIFVFSNVLTQAFYSGSDYWLQLWIKQEESNYGENSTNNFLSWIWNNLFPHFNISLRSQQIYFYSFLIVMLFILTLIRTMGFFKMCMHSSIALHKKLFLGVLRAPMIFFEQNPVGRILNRFSKDIGTIDELLPFTLFDTVEVSLQVVGVVVVITLVNPIFLIPSFFIGIMLFMTRNYFQKTSRNLKRLEGSARSPVFSHLSTSLSGLTTIRAFGAQEEFQRDFESHLDLHSSVFYLFISSVRWLAIVIDWISVSYIAIVIYGVVLLKLDSAAAGLAISSAMGLTCFFQWGVRQSCESENQMVSVERVLEYANIEPEAPFESAPGMKPPEDWPSQGGIEVENLFLAYDGPLGPPFLKNICFRIAPLEKIGIVGRTGSGKTSLISVLFRLTEPSHGTIKIDGVNVLDLGLHDIRSKIAIIPQDPVLFLGTLRMNLDPFGEHSDADIWEALKNVHLFNMAKEIPEGLDSLVSEGGSNFSVGQRQLICMGRAILRKNKILVMDEATANVDSETDALIQNTVRTKFMNCTVLTVAHRLGTVIDSNRIMVLDSGSIQEFDEPYKLLQNPSGGLYHLVHESGPEIALKLIKTAKETANERMQFRSRVGSPVQRKHSTS